MKLKATPFILIALFILGAISPAHSEEIAPTRAEEVATLQVKYKDADRFIRQLNMQGFAVRFREYRNGFDTELAAGPDDPDRDLTAVGYHDFGEHKIVNSVFGIGEEDQALRIFIIG